MDFRPQFEVTLMGWQGLDRHQSDLVRIAVTCGHRLAERLRGAVAELTLESVQRIEADFVLELLGDPSEELETVLLSVDVHTPELGVAAAEFTSNAVRVRLGTRAPDQSVTWDRDLPEVRDFEDPDELATQVTSWFVGRARQRGIDPGFT